ncbi:MAG: hypothetical protein HC905_21200 [Bacteroidales bacterium]|nr:hypothetical protein [Bacteroidales bacterium]
MGALGGDATSLSINPGGIGVYRSSEFTITTGVNYDIVNSTYLSKYEDFKYKMNISNLAYIYTYNTNKTTGWVSASFGIAYNRLADLTEIFLSMGKMLKVLYSTNLFIIQTIRWVVNIMRI